MIKSFLNYKSILLFLADAFLIFSILFMLALVLKFMLVDNHKESINLMLKFGIYIYLLYILCLFWILYFYLDLTLKSYIWSNYINFNDLYNINLNLIFSKILISFFFIIVYLIGLHFFKYQKKINVEYIYFLIFLPLSLILLLNSTDLIYVYIIIELSSLLLYILIVSKKY